MNGILKRILKSRAFSFIALLAAVLVPATIALGRAGGGEGFGGGGGGGGGFGGGGGGFGGGGGGGFGGGGYHGGGGGGSVGIGLFIEYCFIHPLFGFFVLAIAITVFYFAGKHGTSTYQGSMIRRGSPLIDNATRQDAITQIQLHDPNFDPDAFCRRVSGAWMKIQAAWCAQQIGNVRPFISDGVAERFSLQFIEQKDSGYRDQMEQMRVNGVTIADAHCAGVFDEIALRIRAQSADYHVSLSDGKRESGDTQVEEFEEIWSFLRKRGATTDVNRDGLMEGHCPNCGAAVEINEAAECSHCKALLRSGQYDWVLTQITQASEWDRNMRALTPGADTLRARDPGFDPQALEDRASVIFWRKSLADRKGKLDPIHKVASEGYCKEYLDKLHAMAQPNGRLLIGECAVGSVATLGILPSGDGEPMDRALVQVRWSGKTMSASAGGDIHKLGDNVIYTSVYVLGRLPSTQTNADRSISSAHCPRCGAPESGGATNACEFCGAVLNDGSNGWILLEIMRAADPVAQGLLQEAHAEADAAPSNRIGERTGSVAAFHGSPSGLLAWCVQMAAMDGTISAEERDSLQDFAAASGISQEQLDTLLEAARTGNLHVPQPNDSIEANEWLYAIARIAVADGKIDASELTLLRNLASTTGVSDYDLQMLLRKAKSNQYAAARQAMFNRIQP